MGDLSIYPVHSRKNIRKLMLMVSTDADTAYRMITMTAALMDLGTGDPKIIDNILLDCNAEELEVRA